MSKKTLCARAESGNDYLVKVKANQPKLYQQIATQSRQQIALKKFQNRETTRNRSSYRQVEVFEIPAQLHPKWVGVGCVIKVERSGTRGNEPYQSISYYREFFITSISPRAQTVFEDIG